MPLITITDSFGTNGNEIARIVAQDLGVGLFDDKRLQFIVKETEVSVRTDYRFGFILCDSKGRRIHGEEVGEKHSLFCLDLTQFF